MLGDTMLLNSTQTIKVGRPSPKQRSPASNGSSHSVALVTNHSSKRALSEQFIQQKYFEVFDAKITDFMPYLLVMDSQDGVEAASGLRPAADQTLFLENYIAGTIEQEMNDYLGTSIRREKIVEIGNFASIGNGSSRFLFILLAAILEQAEFEWVVFTGTPQICKSLNLSGFTLHSFGAANPSFLSSNEYNKWGTYYRTNPQVSVCSVVAAMQVVSSKPLLRRILEQYKPLINEMSTTLRSGYLNEKRTYAA
jgi:hypothetical protein